MCIRDSLNICGSEYAITSDEAEEYVRELGGQVDRDMRALLHLSLIHIFYGRADNIHLPAPLRTPPAVMLLITGALVALSVL